MIKKNSPSRYFVSGAIDFKFFSPILDMATDGWPCMKNGCWRRIRGKNKWLALWIVYDHNKWWTTKNGCQQSENGKLDSIEINEILEMKTCLLLWSPIAISINHPCMLQQVSWVHCIVFVQGLDFSINW